MKIFLIALAILLITSCELPSIIEADEYLEPIPVNVSENIPISDDVWGRIRITSEKNQGYLDKKTIEYINVYLKNPDQLDLLFEKGRYFIYFVLEELERYSLPSELALLPYIESSYDPFSISSSGMTSPLIEYKSEKSTSASSAKNCNAPTQSRPIRDKRL